MCLTPRETAFFRRTESDCERRLNRFGRGRRCASAKLSGTQLWTRDKRLIEVAELLGLAHQIFG